MSNSVLDRFKKVVLGPGQVVDLGIDAPSETNGITIRVTGLPGVGQVETAGGVALTGGQPLPLAELLGLRNRGDGSDLGGGVFSYEVTGAGPAATGSVQVETRSEGGALYFRADDGTFGSELWRLTADGQVAQVADINPGPGNSFPGDFTVLGGALYFSPFEGSSGREL